MPCVDMDEEDGPDDSDITPAEVVADVLGKTPERSIIRQANRSGLSSVADTDDLADNSRNVAPEVAVEVEEKGRGKRKKKENRLYAGWWRHEAKDGSDMPSEPGMDVGDGMVVEENKHAPAAPQRNLSGNSHGCRNNALAHIR